MRFTRAALVGIVVALVCFAASASAGNGNGNGNGNGRWKEPPRPAQDWPSLDGLSGQGHAFGSLRGGRGQRGTGGTTSGGPGAPGNVGATTLVLYDTTGAYGWLGELYATYAGNLASHFGSWKAEPVSTYQAGQISQYTATIYIGSTYDEPLPSTFLADVYNDASHPVIWIYDNIWQLTSAYPTFQSKYGWMWSQFDLSTVSNVLYKGIDLTRDGADNQAGIMNYSAVDPTKAQVLASAVRDSDGSTFPWAIRSGMLTYVGENPFVYTTETDRVIAFDDMLYDALEPNAPTLHRAMIRLEDNNPTSDPAQLKQIADYLYSQNIPFGFEFISVYTDPNGYYNNGTPETIVLKKNTEIAKTIQYMEARGGTLVAHGYTHQYSNIPNPYTGVTADDAEFFRMTENPDGTVNFTGPVPDDSPTWAASRMLAAIATLQAAGAGTPKIWTFPHYAASDIDYRIASALFPTRWERPLYFGGSLTGGTIDYSHMIGETFPYVVHDIYGATVLPENLGDYSPEPFYAYPPHGVDSILAAGAANLAVRDGIAAFFYHPFEGLAPLEQIVDGIRSEGYTFASPAQVAAQG